MSITADDNGDPSFSVFPYSPVENIDIVSIVIFLKISQNHSYHEDDIFCFGKEEMTIKKLVDGLNEAMAKDGKEENA